LRLVLLRLGLLLRWSLLLGLLGLAMLRRALMMLRILPRLCLSLWLWLFLSLLIPVPVLLIILLLCLRIPRLCVRLGRILLRHIRNRWGLLLLLLLLGLLLLLLVGSIRRGIRGGLENACALAVEARVPSVARCAVAGLVVGIGSGGRLRVIVYGSWKMRMVSLRKTKDRMGAYRKDCAWQHSLPSCAQRCSWP
jgi:hypothetical protein